MTRRIRGSLVGAATLCVAVSAAWLPATAAAIGTPNVQWYGGPVMPALNSNVVLWGADVATQMQTDIPAFLSAYAGASGGGLPVANNVFSALAEYSTAGTTSAATGGAHDPAQVIQYKQHYNGMTTISPTVGPGAATATVQDSDIQAELAKDIDNAVLPVPPGDGTTTDYIVLFPPKDTIELEGSFSGQEFCAYHSSFMHLGYHVIYTVMPDQEAEMGGCGTSSTVTENTDFTFSHELEDMITDPLIGESMGSNAPPLAWYSNAQENESGEIAQVAPCPSDSATQTVNGVTLTIQKFWSKLFQSCIAGDGPSTFTDPVAEFTSQTSGATASFHDASSGDNRGWFSNSWDFGDGTSGSGPNPTHTYTAPGVYNVTENVTDNDGFTAGFLAQVTIPASAFPAVSTTTTASSTAASTTAASTTAASTTAASSTAAAGSTRTTSTTTSTSSSSTHSAAAPPAVTGSGPPSTSLVGGVIVVNTGETVACPPGGAPCGVQVGATVPAAGTASASRAPKHPPKVIIVAATNQSVPAGQTRPVTFRLNHTGTSLLRKHKITAKVTITVIYAGARKAVSTRTITIREPPAKKKRR